MKKAWIRLIVILMSLNMLTAHAQTNATNMERTQSEQERAYLIQLMNQIDTMKTLILSAEKSQPKNQRQVFHYRAWHDASGQHNGLLEDVDAIQQGIQDKLNGVTVEPYTVSAIQGDYQ